MDKQEQIEQLENILNTISEIDDIEFEIETKEKELNSLKNELISLEMKKEAIDKIRQDKPFNPLPFVSSYTKLLSSFRPRQDCLIGSIRSVFFKIYIILGVALIGWSGFQIFAYFNQTTIPLYQAIIHAVSYEIVLIVVWLICNCFLFVWAE